MATYLRSCSRSKKKDFIIDCVLDEFNYEKRYKDKFDTVMDGIDGIPIAMLSGIGELNDDDQRCFNDICEGNHFKEIDKLEGLGEVAPNSMIDDAVKKQLIDTRNFISNNPASMNLQGGAAHWLKMLN